MLSFIPLAVKVVFVSALVRHHLQISVPEMPDAPLGRDVADRSESYARSGLSGLPR